MKHRVHQVCFIVIACLFGFSWGGRVVFAQALPGTQLLSLEQPLHEVMMAGIGEHAERELFIAREARTAPWLPSADGEQPEMSREDALQSLRDMIGLHWSKEVSGLWVSEKSDPESGGAEVVQLHVRDGIYLTAYRFSGTPKNERNQLVYILLSDPDEFPNMELVQRIIAQGHTVYCPVLVDRGHKHSMHPNIAMTNLPHREYVYRAGFNVGCHPVGYEVEKVLKLATILRTPDPHTEGGGGGMIRSKVAVVGIGEGGLIALLAGALGEDSIDAVAVSGYFGPRENVWEEPIYRNIFGQLKQFGDAELASLIAPRTLAIESGSAPEIDGSSVEYARQGERKIAAPGKIVSPKAADVKREYDRAKLYYQRAGTTENLHLTAKNEAQSGTPETVRLINESLGFTESEEIPATQELSKISPVGIEKFQKQALTEMIADTQRKLRECDNLRAIAWKPARSATLEEWKTLAPKYREMVHGSFIGKLPPSTLPFNPHSRQVIDDETHSGYEVTLDVYAEGDIKVIAGGILLLPKGMKPDEQRPVVVCQHGLEGEPMDTITTDESERAFKPYKGFATQLVKRGFIVYAPQNPYKGFDNFRVIQRKANPLGRSLFSYIIEQHRQTLKWLATLPNVDSKRIGFYGLSYGGKTAMRVPQLLVPSETEVGYCLSICSADFNDWIRKNASTEDRYSYVYTGEYEIFEWNMGHVANYAELGTLMMPRPFMVERGHHDGVAPDEWVAAEFAKVKRDYVLAGIGDQAEIEWFNGPHSINGDGTFRFLHQHLNWPVKQSE